MNAARTFDQITSRDDIAQVLSLVDDLGDCADSREIVTAAARRYA